MNELPFIKYLPILHIERFIPGPDRFYRAAGSLVAATAFGAAYGLIGRVIYPQAGILPLHYAVWFSVAFQIKYTYEVIENQFEKRLGSYFHRLETISEGEDDLYDQIRSHCWQIVRLKNTMLKNFDAFLSRFFQIRPYQDVKADNVQDASFLEMCRYRIWRVFKLTILDSVTSALAYRLTNRMGFTLPNRTVVPLFIVIYYIAQDILLIPSLYLYARFCEKIAAKLRDSDPQPTENRTNWLRQFLPAL